MGKYGRKRSNNLEAPLLSIETVHSLGDIRNMRALAKTTVDVRHVGALPNTLATLSEHLVIPEILERVNSNRVSRSHFAGLPFPFYSHFRHHSSDPCCAHFYKYSRASSNTTYKD